MEKEVCVDALVLLDNGKTGFHSYVEINHAIELYNTGLANAEYVNLRESDKYSVPDSLKNGESAITDLLIRMEVNKEYFLN